MSDLPHGRVIEVRPFEGAGSDRRSVGWRDRDQGPLIGRATQRRQEAATSWRRAAASLPVVPADDRPDHRTQPEDGAMPQRAWSAKRERQYEHIKDGLLDSGRSEDKAEEIAARTVNKERARAGEARTASRTSLDDISSSRRGGLRSHSGSEGRTYDQLRNEAREKGIKGRSTMTKAELQRTVDR
jgi:plasmid stabilization system protein ParE